VDLVQVSPPGFQASSPPASEAAVSAGLGASLVAPAAAALAPPRRRDVYDVLWDLLTSVRIAIALILLLTAAAFIGSLLIQPVQTVDPRLITDPQQHAQFMNFARARYGFLAGPLAPQWLRDATVETMDALNLFDVFNALWFRALLVVLACSVTMCTLNRLEPVWRTLRQPVVRRSDRYYDTARTRRVLGPLPGDRIRTVLARNRYRLHERNDGALYLLGDRNAWARAGTLASHTALLLLITGGAVGTLFGFQEDLAIPNGASLPVYPVGATNNITVRNERFAARFRDDGSPADYYSDLVLVQNGVEVARQRVRVNEPLRYQGLAFHQSSYGPSADVEVRDAATQRVLFSQIVNFFDAVDGVPVDRQTLPTTDDLFVMLPPRATPFLAAQIYKGDVLQGVAAIEIGQTQRIGDYLVTFRGPTQYTVIRVVRNAGESLLFVAAALFIGGVLATFWFPRRRLWIRADERSTVLTGIGDRTFDLESELDRLVGELA
jgi:cytochrome c biogenesis protein